MDEKEFKKHLADLAHGHHHPDEHDCEEPKGEPRTTGAVGSAGAAREPEPKAKRKPPQRARSSRVKRKGA